MTVEALRIWGMTASAALMSVALLIAAQPGASAQNEAERVNQPAPGQWASSVAFLVRFRGEGPIARAQVSASQGREEAARRQIEAQLVRQTAFEGLCFERFTVGAAEVVLRSCDPVPADERATFEAAWLARLRAMRAVEYVDANASVSADRR